MKRILAVGGLIGVLAGTPLLLIAIGGAPRIPSFEGVSLSSDYMPLDPVLDVLALLAWAVWAYLVLAVALRVAAEVAAAWRMPGHRALASASGLIIPPPIRRMIDFAIGGALVAATITGRTLASEAPRKTAAAVVVSPSSRDADPPGRVRPQVETRSYVVRPGDSLWRIAERELGSGFKWREIYELNEGRRFEDGRCLRSPRLIHPGWRLRLPSDGLKAERDAAAPSPTPRAQRALEPLPAHHTQPSSSFDGRATGTTAHEQAAPHEPATTAEQDHREEAPVLRLPSGLAIAASFASGLLTAELLGRLRRRRARLPLAAESPDEGAANEASADASLARHLRYAGASPGASALDLALEEVSETWRRHTGENPRVLAALEDRRGITVFMEAAADTPLPLGRGGTVSPLVTFDRWESGVRAEVRGPFPPRLRRVVDCLEQGLLVPVGSGGRGTVVHVGLLAQGGLSVGGSRAEDALRQVLLALAAPADRDELQIHLLGLNSVSLDGLPHLARGRDWEEAGDALQELQAEFIRRARILADEGTDDIWEHLGQRSDERFPAIILVAGEPPAPIRGVLEGIGQEAPALGAVLVSVGWSPMKSGLRIVVDDNALDIQSPVPVPRRLTPFVLDPETAAGAVRIIAARDRTMEERPPETTPPQASAEEPDRQDTATPLFVRTPTSVPEVRCLGLFQVNLDGDPLEEGWRRKSKELLAYLIAHPHGAPKDEIMEAMWPGMDPRRGHIQFDVAASCVRAMIRKDNSRRFIEKTGDVFRLEPGAWWIDVHDFERLVNEAERTIDPSRAIERLRKAVELYKGNFCHDAYYSWAEPVRERYRSLAVRACARLAELLSQQSDLDGALEALERGIAADAHCEDLWRRAMKLEVSMGRSAAAKDRYNRLEALLAETLEVEPDQATQKLLRQIEDAGRPAASG